VLIETILTVKQFSNLWFVQNGFERNDRSMSENKKAYDFAKSFSEMEKTTEFDNHGNHTTIRLNVHLSALEACADKTDVLQEYGYPSFEEMLKDDIVGVVQLDAYENNSIALTLILYSVLEKDSYPIPLNTEELTAVRQEIEKILHIDLSELAKAGAENDNTRWNVLVQESIDFQNEHELEMNGLAKKYILISSEMIEPDDYIATEPEYVAVSFSLPDNMTERLLDREGIAEEYNFKSGKEMIDSDFWIDYEAVIDDKGLYQSHSIYFLSIYRYFLSYISSKNRIYATMQSYSVYLIKRNLNLTA